MPSIRRLTSLEILDSRGRPTVEATCELASGALGTASVPSGASTGTAEALELRDGDQERYKGWGCKKAVGHINGEIHHACSGRTFQHQDDLDRALIELDGSRNKARLGANALLAVSLAFARAVAMESDMPLYRHFADILGQTLHTLPRPTINLFSGGKHAGGQIAIQDVLVVPVAARTMDEALTMTFAIYQAAIEVTFQKYAMRALTADEGGLAPPYSSAEEMLGDAMEAIRRAGLEPGRQVAIAVDVASSHFYRDGHYYLEKEPLTSTGMIERILGWLTRYPIVSVEDGLAEEDWQSWPELCARLKSQAVVLGDDLLCTNPQRISRAIAYHAANALLLKVNQVGTLTEAAEAYRLARSAGWGVTISARSGETEDNWLADLAVGWAGDCIKIGSITHGERLAKYNRLLAIEAATGFPLVAWCPVLAT
jgi:enolase